MTRVESSVDETRIIYSHLDFICKLIYIYIYIYIYLHGCDPELVKDHTFIRTRCIKKFEFEKGSRDRNKK